MSKYKVLKEFITETGFTYRPDRGVFPVPPTWEKIYIEFLITNKFIEEIKEPSRWRAPFNGTYYAVGIKNDCREMIDNHDPYNDEVYQSRNYFRSKKTTELVTEAQKLFFEWLHAPLEITADEKNDLWARMYDAQDKAHRAVLKDNESAI